MLPDYRFMIAAILATVIFVVLSFELLLMVRLGHMPSALATIEQRRLADDRPLAPGPALFAEFRSDPSVAAETAEPPQISAEERAQLASLIALSAALSPRDRGDAPVLHDRTVAILQDPASGSRALVPDPPPIGGPLAEPLQMVGSIGPIVPIPRTAAEVRREREQADIRRRRARAAAVLRARLQAEQRAKAEAEAAAARNPFAALFGGGGGGN